MLAKNQRPKYLNLFKIRQPVTAVVSIIHRMSGVMLFLLIPFLIYWFAASLRSEADFVRTLSLFSTPWLKILGILAAAALIHHFFAGLRFLLLDFDIGMRLAAARASAWLVFACVVLALGALLFGVLL